MDREKLDEEKRIALDAPTVSIAELPSGAGEPLDREMHRSLSRREVAPGVRLPAEFRTLSIHVEDKIDQSSSNSSEGAAVTGKGVVKGTSHQGHSYIGLILINFQSSFRLTGTRSTRTKPCFVFPSRRRAVSTKSRSSGVSLKTARMSSRSLPIEFSDRSLAGYSVASVACFLQPPSSVSLRGMNLLFKIIIPAQSLVLQETSRKSRPSSF